MDRLFHALRPLIRAVVGRPGWVVALALALSAVSLFLARDIRIDTDFAKLLPPERASVQAIERLRETVGGESDVAVAIESPSLEANQRFAEALIPRALALQGERYEAPYLIRADYRRDADFLRDNALYFATDAELNQLDTFLQDKIDEAALAANPFYFDLEGEGEAETDTAAQELQQVYERLTVDEYTLSPDSTVLVVRFFPSGSQTDIGFIDDLYADLRRLVDEMEPASYQAQMEVTLAGRLYRQLVEVQTIQRDVFGSFGAGVAAVLLVTALYFLFKAYRARAGRRLDRRVLLAELARTPVMALMIGLPLLMSLTWAAALAYLAFGTLNLMTSTLGLVLFGLGIDYGIHFYARYTEERAAGHSVAEAVEETFATTGQAIAVGAVATAAGLYVLGVADFRGFSEFGVVAGSGVLFALVAMTLVLPALLALAERTRLLNLEARADAVRPAHVRRRFPAPRGVVAARLAGVVVALVLVPHVRFEYDFGALEPAYPTWEARDAVVERTDDDDGGPTQRNPAYVVLDERSEAEGVVRALRQKIARDTLTPTIDRVESLQERFPVEPAAQEARLERIAEIRTLLTENRYLSRDSLAQMQRLRRAAGTREAIALAEVPEFLTEQFTDREGEVGNFVIIYPSVGLSDGRLSMAFRDDVGTFEANGQTYHAASTSLVAADMLHLMLAEAPWMVAATFGIVALLMWLNFRSVRWAALALVPLVVGVLWMILLMEVFALSLTFYNLVVLPAILGIGNDAGVHLVHRFREEGRGSILHVLRSAGQHVAMGSLTTMIGFGGLLLSFHPGLRSIGLLAVTGIGTTLLAALLFLPAMLQWLEDREALPTDAGLHGAGDLPGGDGRAKGEADALPHAPESARA